MGSMNLGIFGVALLVFRAAFYIVKHVFMGFREVARYTARVFMTYRITRREEQAVDVAKAKLDSQAGEAASVAEPAVAAAPQKREAPSASATPVERQAPAAAKTAAPSTEEAVRSGLHACDVTIADKHAIRKIGGRPYRFSMYRDAGKVERFDQKEQSKLEPFTRSLAKKHGLAFSLDEAIRFTATQIAAAKKSPAPSQPAKPGKTSKAAAPAPDERQPAPDAMPDYGDGDLPPEMPPWMNTESMSSQQEDHYEQFVAREAKMAPPEVGQTSVDDEEPTWEPDAYQGVIKTLEWQARRRSGGRGFKIYTMTLDTESDGDKEFGGVEMQTLAQRFDLKVGDTVQIRKGTQPFTTVKGDGESERRTRNVFNLHVVARAMNGRRRYANGK
ncbi:hypothetical protein [Burkholderia sp. Ac-20365]|uniref:hypothetical protein n=1 Tax=Burkholderia sp. Ac-20365 TaxID=2703897 RepID=UPI00197BF9E0|nr:hypothetical protein [Burkholderia sp. Ac-20365]MBN3760979.1 hypothetical protein [Burkholderia sp. Ac-20365]